MHNFHIHSCYGINYHLSSLLLIDINIFIIIYKFKLLMPKYQEIIIDVSTYINKKI